MFRRRTPSDLIGNRIKSVSSMAIKGRFSGDSDFRKLSILLIATWFPFPIWFSVSIEGFGLITDYLVIEMGWVILNIVSKRLETPRQEAFNLFSDYIMLCKNVQYN